MTSSDIPERKIITIVCSPLPPHIPIAISKNAENALGRAAADCIGNPNFLASLVHPEDVFQIIAGFHHLSLRSFHISEYRILEKTSGAKRVLVELQLVRDHTGKPDKILFYLSMPPLSAEQDGVEAFHTPAADSDRGIAVKIDEGYRISSISPSIEKFLGYKQDSIIRKHVYDLIPPDYQPVANTAFIRIMERRKDNAQLWTAFHHRDGGLRFVSVAAAGINTGGKRLIAAACNDITSAVLARRIYVERMENRTVSFDRRSPVEDTSDTAASFGKILTIREQEVLTLIARGKSNKEIADQLRISSRTVEAHRSTIMRKLRIKSHAGLIHYAIRMNFLSAQQTPTAS